MFVGEHFTISLEWKNYTTCKDRWWKMHTRYEIEFQSKMHESDNKTYIYVRKHGDSKEDSTKDFLLCATIARIICPFISGIDYNILLSYTTK